MEGMGPEVVCILTVSERNQCMQQLLLNKGLSKWETSMKWKGTLLELP